MNCRSLLQLIGLGFLTPAANAAIGIPVASSKEEYGMTLKEARALRDMLSTPGAKLDVNGPFICSDADLVELRIINRTTNQYWLMQIPVRKES